MQNFHKNEFNVELLFNSSTQFNFKNTFPFFLLCGWIMSPQM